jgi:stage III sporulation protein SpoIIIAA
LGKSSDILKFSDKNTAFEAGIRAMRPDVIITDELSPDDCEGAKKAIVAGVCVVASAHFSAIEHVKEPFLGLFDCFVVLNSREIGVVKGIYDRTGNLRI